MRTCSRLLAVEVIRNVWIQEMCCRLSQKNLWVDWVTYLSIKCSKETKCFAASVGMAAKGLIYWGKIHLLIEDGCFWGWCPDVRLTDLRRLVPYGLSSQVQRRKEKMLIMIIANID